MRAERDAINQYQAKAEQKWKDDEASGKCKPPETPKKTPGGALKTIIPGTGYYIPGRTPLYETVPVVTGTDSKRVVHLR